MKRFFSVTTFACLLIFSFHTARAQDQPCMVKFPASLDSQDSLCRQADNAASQLSSAITNVSTSITLLDASRFPQTGLAVINGIEKVTWTSKTGNTLNGVMRAFGGTLAVSHASGASVRMTYVKEYHEKVVDSLAAMQLKLGKRASTPPPPGANVAVPLMAVAAGESEYVPLSSLHVTTALGYAPLRPSLNLSDIVNPGTARTNLGLGTAATKDVTASGNAAAGQVVKGDDTRLNDARTPVAHTHTESDFLFSDVTTNNANATRHGLLSKLPDDSSLCLRGNGSWIACVAASAIYDSVNFGGNTSGDALLKKNPSNASLMLRLGDDSAYNRLQISKLAFGDINGANPALRANGNYLELTSANEGTFLYMNAGRYHVPFTGSYNFSPTSDGTAAPDTGFARASAAVAKVTDGASGDGSLTVANNVYGAGWNGSQQVPTRDDVFDKIETLAPLASPAFTGTPSAPALSITGTGGGGFLQLANQSSTPSTPTSAGRIYFDSANKFSWIGTNGFTRSFDGTANTANRVYTLPDADSKFPILSQFLTFTGPTAARTFALPDVSTTLCGTNAVCTGYGATANPLSQFASTTSAQLAGVLSDETGSASPGVAMFSNSPTVKAGTSANTTFTIDTTSASQAASIVFSEAGTAKASIQHNPSTLSGGFIIQAGGIASPANTRFAISATGNIGINTTSAFGGGAGVLGMLNATTAPTSTPTGGGIIWIEGGALKYKGSSGTVTTLANPYRTFSRFINPIRAKYGRFMFTK